MKQIFTTIFLLLFLSGVSRGQSFLYELEDSLDADALVSVIRGPGISEVFDAHVGLCGPKQRGRFDAHGQANDLGMDRGIMLSGMLVRTDSSVMLSSGLPRYLGLGFPYSGPSMASGGLNVYLDEPSDEIPLYDPNLVGILDALPLPYHLSSGQYLGHNRYRASLEFSFVPTGDSISFRYVVFSRQHIPLCSISMNIYTAFLSGPGLDTPVNIALIPGTETMVTTNTIGIQEGDPVGYCTALDPDAPYNAYYIDNTVLMSDHLPYAGFSTILEAHARVNPCDTYSIRITASSRVYDHGIFIEAESFRSNGVSESCSDTSTGVRGLPVRDDFFRVYPNPFGSSLQVSLEGSVSASSSSYRVVLTDVFGRVYYDFEGSLGVLNRDLLRIGEGLSEGVYFLSVKDMENGWMQVAKVVRRGD